MTNQTNYRGNKFVAQCGVHQRRPRRHGKVLGAVNPRGEFTYAYPIGSELFVYWRNVNAMFAD